MSLFVPLAQGIQVELVYKLDNRILTNRLWFRVVAGDPTTADLIAVGEGVRDWCVSEILPLLSVDIKLLGTRAYDATVPYPGPQVLSPAGFFGTFADDSHSANVAIKMSFFTTNPPGIWLNWNFVGGIPKEAVNLNTVEPVYADALSDAYVVLLDVFSLFEYRWVATRAVIDGVPLSTRDAFRIDHIRNLTGRVSQRRTRLDNPP